MTISIVQSNYIPWKGYFDAMNCVDEFVIYDDMQYTKGDWRNRNKIKTQNGFDTDSGSRCFHNHHFIMTLFTLSLITGPPVPPLLGLGFGHGDTWYSPKNLNPVFPRPGLPPVLVSEDRVLGFGSNNGRLLFIMKR